MMHQPHPLLPAGQSDTPTAEAVAVELERLAKLTGDPGVRAECREIPTGGQSSTLDGIDRHAIKVTGVGLTASALLISENILLELDPIMALLNPPPHAAMAAAGVIGRILEDEDSPELVEAAEDLYFLLSGNGGN